MTRPKAKKAAKRAVASVDLGGGLAERVDTRCGARGGRSTVAKRDLARYYDLLDGAWERVRRRFTPKDLTGLASALHPAHERGELSPRFLGAITGTLDIDDDVRGTVRALSSEEAAALLDHLERTWAARAA